MILDTEMKNNLIILLACVFVVNMHLSCRRTVETELMPTLTAMKYKIEYGHDTIVIESTSGLDTLCLGREGYVNKEDGLLFLSTQKDTVFHYRVLNHEYRVVIRRVSSDTAMYCTSTYRVERAMADDDFWLLTAYYYDDGYVIKKIVRSALVSFE